MSESSKKILKAELETVCGITSKFPEHIIPEFAFAGKSNVGKSSLINALMQRKSLARTSASPGKTQTINYYNVNDEYYFVDLPGYGYTKVSESVKAEWGRMVERYLKKSRMLKAVFLLVDIRHKPTEDDKLMFTWIRSQGFEPVVIATKSDKLGKNDKPKALKLIRETLKLTENDILIPFSSETKDGREDIYKFLDKACENDA
ncbi:MAG: ribosome biogenesis GTP-binding protein YihA/YsxC [Eubacteriales bacterium]|nr:ribosome biogenesis GTP-binding protein YihA/YsxC [Eubacteriales bacterium]